MIIQCNPDIDRTKVPLTGNSNVHYILETDVRNSIEPIIYRMVSSIMIRLARETDSCLSMPDNAYSVLALQEETKKKQSNNNKMLNQNTFKSVLKTINLMLYQSRNREA